MLSSTEDKLLSHTKHGRRKQQNGPVVGRREWGIVGEWGEVGWRLIPKSFYPILFEMSGDCLLSHMFNLKKPPCGGAAPWSWKRDTEISLPGRISATLNHFRMKRWICAGAEEGPELHYWLSLVSAPQALLSHLQGREVLYFFALFCFVLFCFCAGGMSNARSVCGVVRTWACVSAPQRDLRRCPWNRIPKATVGQTWARA